jgi:hypothetical protein
MAPTQEVPAPEACAVAPTVLDPDDESKINNGLAGLGSDMEAVLEQVRAMDSSVTERAKECDAAVAAALAESRTPLPGMEDYVARCEAAINEKDVDLRKGIGQKFSQWLKEHPDAAKQYAECKTPGKTMQQKRDFRLRWAAEQIDENSTIHKTKLESYQIIETEDGTYEPLEMIVMHEGGKDSPAAWQAALNYLQVCMTLGGMWMQFNHFTKRVDILYIKKTRRSVFQQKWAMYTESIRDLKSIEGAGADVEAKSTEDAETPDQKVAAKRGAAGNGAQPVAKRACASKDGGAGSSSGNNGKPDKPLKAEKQEKAKPSALDIENAKLLKTCQSLKTTYLKVCTIQNNMLKVLRAPVAEDEAWAALANPTNITSLTNLMSKVEDSTKGDFPYAFLNGDVVSLKKDYNNNMTSFWFNLRTFMSGFSEAIKCLDCEQQRLHRMYRAGKL